MKFLVSKDTAPTPLLRQLMTAVTVAMLLYLLLDVVLHGYLIGFSPQAAAQTLYGNEEAFVEPILFESLLLQVHIDLFMALVSLLIVVSIYLRMKHKEKVRKGLLHALFLSALAAPLLLIAAYFGGSFWLYGWVGAFYLWHLLALFVGMVALKRLIAS